MRMIRTEEWKLVRHYKTNLMDELYHLKADPHETENRLGRNPDPAANAIRAKLEEQLEAWMRSIDDPLLR